NPTVILVLLLLAFYFIHYLFASSTAHVTALLTIFLVSGRNIPGIDFPLLTYVLLYSLGLMGILTPYATGPSPIWYGLGYIQSKTFWQLGAFFGIIFIAVLIFVGIPWIKLWI
ncbi:MAG: anion permease, partial [Prolixibacteraceae bacterium]|nr:anion permease [Prolixibacteraceae bacterium]